MRDKTRAIGITKIKASAEIKKEYETSEVCMGEMLDSVSADHTLGDADEDNWIGFTHLKSVSDQGNKIVLKYEYGLNTCDAVLIPQNRGFRFYTREKGDFDSEAVSYTFSEIEGEYQIKTAHSVIVITVGDDWKICADEKFVLDADNFN